MIAGALSAVALMVCGRIENGNAAGPLNGPSQWLWGEHAARDRRWNRHTLAGVVIHQLSSLFWATLHVHAISRGRERRASSRMVRAAATGAFAAAVDYGITPRRLQPGFDKQLSLPSLVVVYAAFAAGLAFGDSLFGERRRQDGTN